MATIALPRPIAPHRSSSPLPSHSHTLSLDSINTAAACPIPIPNKHIPVCPPGPAPSQKPDTPPASPPTKHSGLPTDSLLYPPDQYTSTTLNGHPVYSIDAAALVAAVDHLSSQSLPDPTQVFPWLHGLHPHNHIQQAFFIARRRALRRTPTCIRGITIVKADGDLSCSRLKCAIAPDEILQTPSEFKDIDPREGFSVRNFQIQAAKCAMVSDIVIYGENKEEVETLAGNIAIAQQTWRETHQRLGHELPRYNTFICTSSFDEFEIKYPKIVAISSDGLMTGNIMDFFHQERIEMATMTKASEIAQNVWLGPTPDSAIDPTLLEDEEDSYDILIECSDLGRLNPKLLEKYAEGMESGDHDKVYLEFPSSGSVMPPTWSLTEADAIVESCKWIYHLANGTRPNPSEADTSPDSEGDSPMPSPTDITCRPRKILFHCTDGYTETSMLALAYYIYSTGVTVSEGWLQLHTIKRRNFFAYPSDVALLNAISPRLLGESPSDQCNGTADICAKIQKEPKWLSLMDGSLPSRVLDYMYLGNLGHANNPDLLRAMGIGQILSVGETATWADGETDKWPEENICVIQSVQDNGVDPLTEEFDRCLAFIGKLLIHVLSMA